MSKHFILVAVSTLSLAGCAGNSDSQSSAAGSSAGGNAVAGASGAAKGGETGAGGTATAAAGSASTAGAAGTTTVTAAGAGGAMQGGVGGATQGGVGGVGGTGGTSTAGGPGGGNGGVGGGGGGAASSCTMVGTWPAGDPAVAGPYPVTTETNVGPTAGVANDDGEVKRFNVYRPTTLGMAGVCHPVVMWNNGHGDRPATYEVLLKQLASHGFVVVASLSSNTSQGMPRPAIAGIDWIVAQSNDSASQFYHHLDTAHIGITGHSEGAFASVTEGSDPRVTTVASICGATANMTLHGPALLTCGGKDMVAKCSGVETAFNSVNNVPVMFASNLASDHGSWLYQGGIKGPTIVAVTGWMRVHLMADTSLRSMFYGADCKLCTDTEHWSVKQKMMAQ